MGEQVLRYGHFKRILICTDFSENSDFAFDIATEAVMRNTNSMLYVLHVFPEPGAQFWRGYIKDQDSMDVERVASREFDERLAGYRLRLPEGVQFEAEARFGNPEQQILAFAQEKAVDLIVMGHQGRSSVFFGNVASRVSRQSVCPVLLVPLAFKRRVLTEAVT
ncbi:MAG: universal stress protein [Lentisphaerae bacterium]|jgi:nucleotide-binding universal stress UspA family protein|nr:universal stress protein [Lentisphaerota bacterium]